MTDKGGDRTQTIVRWDQIRVFGAWLALSIGAIAWAFLGPYAVSEPTPVDKLNLIWAGVSALLSGVACLICIERPRSHREELFARRRPGRIMTQAGTYDFAVSRLSTFDAVGRVSPGKAKLALGSTVQLSLERFGDLRATVGRRRGRNVTLHLDVPEPTRRSLLVDLYGAPNDNVAIEASLGGSLLGLLRRGFGRN